MKGENLFKIEVVKSIEKFENWLSEYGPYSYDRMDYWSSETGILAKKLFYKSKILGAPLAIWGLILENFLPSFQKLYAQPSRQSIGDAHYALAFLNLYEINNDEIYLRKAEKYLKALKESLNKTNSGAGWGYSFGWQTHSGFWEAGVPLITISPYGFWAFKKHFELTGKEDSKDVALKVAIFARDDLNKTSMSNGTICSSYSPVGKDIIINANSYRAAVLIGAYELTSDRSFFEEAQESLSFVLSYQGPKGEWYYEAKGGKNNFIDNFHTCFVIRNLFFCYKITGDEELKKAIANGYDFYTKNLFYENKRPKHFAVSKYFKMRKYEMYDYAEGIKLGVYLKDEFENAFIRSQFLAKDLIKNYQTKKGYFITRVTSLGTQHSIPYHRWPQAQLFFALTLLNKELQK